MGEDLFWSGGVFEERLYSLISESLNKIPEAYVFFLTEVGGGDCGENPVNTSNFFYKINVPRYN